MLDWKPRALRDESGVSPRDRCGCGAFQWYTAKTLVWLETYQGSMEVPLEIHYCAECGGVREVDAIQ